MSETLYSLSPVYISGVYIHPSKVVDVDMMRRVFALYLRADSNHTLYERLFDSVWYPKSDEGKLRKRRYHKMMDTNYKRKEFFRLILEGKIRRTQKTSENAA